MALLKAAIRVTHKKKEKSASPLSVHATAWEINTCDCCVLLSYICTKMDFMLLTLAVRILHSRALKHTKHQGGESSNLTCFFLRV